MTVDNSSSNNTVLLLGAAESLVSIDRQMLRGINAGRVVFSRSGLKVARLLANLDKKSLPGLIFCTDLADMQSPNFLHLIRLHPNLANLPVVLVCSEITDQTILDVSRLGACTLLARPYTQKELSSAIINAKNGAMRPIPAGSDRKIFENMLNSLSTPAVQPKKPGTVKIKEQDLLLMGKKLLRHGHLNAAIEAFSGYIQDNGPKKGEALEGIANAKTQLGLNHKTGALLQQAAVAYIDEEDFQSARSIFSRIATGNDRKPLGNPLYQAGIKLLKQGRFSASAQAFLQGQVLTPSQSFIHHAARGCQFAQNPEACAEELCWHVEQRSPSAGRQLRGYLLIPESKPSAEVKYRGGFLGKVAEVIEVARHTARIYAAS